MSSTLLFGLGQSGVTARLWNRSFNNNEPPPSFDESKGYPGCWDVRGTTDDDQSIGFQNAPAGPACVWFRKPGFTDQKWEGTLPDDGAKEIRLERAPVTLSRLTVDRSGFHNAAGQRVFIAGVSAFMHYERFLNGEDIRPLLQQVQELGANCVRIFGMAHYVPVNAGRRAFKPQDYGDRYFDQIPAFCALCESYGLYVYWSVFPDNELIGVPDQSGFFDRVAGKLKEADTAIGELTNEPDAHSFNYIDPTRMHRPQGIAFNSGSYGDLGGPQPSVWDFIDYHTPRRYPTHIKDSCVVDHPNYLAGTGVLLGEPDRYGTDGNLNQEQARQSAGACRETALGQVFHSTQGRESLRYDDVTTAIARVFFTALRGSL